MNMMADERRSVLSELNWKIEATREQFAQELGAELARQADDRGEDMDWAFSAGNVLCCHIRYGYKEDMIRDIVESFSKILLNVQIQDWEKSPDYLQGVELKGDYQDIHVLVWGCYPES